VFTEYPVPTPNATPYGIMTEPDGGLWFCGRFANKIGVLTP
jgi:virginiamycin B lyase